MATFNGTTGNDSLLGTAGDDTFNPLTGKDTIDGGAGNDTLNIDNSTDTANTTIVYTDAVAGGTITGGFNDGTTLTSKTSSVAQATTILQGMRSITRSTAVQAQTPSLVAQVTTPTSLITLAMSSSKPQMLVPIQFKPRSITPSPLMLKT